jgi:hypothetical protein
MGHKGDMKKGVLKDYVLDPENPGGYRYVGSYYFCTVLDRNRKKNGILQLIGGLLELFFILLAVSINCLGNFKISVVIPVECILICVVLYMTGSYAYMTSPDKMEKSIYEKAFVRTVQTVAVGLVLNGFAMIAQLVVVIRNFDSLEGYGDYILLGMLAILFVCNLATLKYHRGLYKQAGPISVEEDVTGDRD